MEAIALFTRNLADENLMGIIRALLAAAPLRYLGGVPLPGPAATTWAYLEDKEVAMLTALIYAPGQPEGQRLRMMVLLEATPDVAAELAGELRARTGGRPGLLQLEYADLVTGDDVVGFAGALRRLGRAAATRLAPVFGPDLGEFGWPGPLVADAGTFARDLRARLRG